MPSLVVKSLTAAWMPPLSTDVRMIGQLHSITFKVLKGTIRPALEHKHTVIYVDGTAGVSTPTGPGPPACAVVVLQEDQWGIL